MKCSAKEGKCYEIFSAKEGKCYKMFSKGGKMFSRREKMLRNVQQKKENAMKF